MAKPKSCPGIRSWSQSWNMCSNTLARILRGLYNVSWILYNSHKQSFQMSAACSVILRSAIYSVAHQGMWQKVIKSWKPLLLLPLHIQNFTIWCQPLNKSASKHAQSMFSSLDHKEVLQYEDSQIVAPKGGKKKPFEEIEASPSFCHNEVLPSSLWCSIQLREQLFEQSNHSYDLL